jgi:general stress protein 26
MRWSEFEASAPPLAAAGRERLEQPGVVLVATIRNDGTPRISPVEPFFWEGDVWLSMMWRSAKAADLARDPRVLVHSIITNRDGEEGEYKLRGTVETVSDRNTRARYATAVGQALDWQPEEPFFHLFRVEIEDVTFIRYEEGDQRVVRWPEKRHFIRRLATATSVGEPEEQAEFRGP